VHAPLSRALLRGRLSTYLVDHYLATHITAVNISLGVAGLSAASLFGSNPAADGYRTLFWLLWSTSLLATVAAYSGTMIGAALLPVRIPSVVDLVLPLLLSVSEFLLFGLLAYNVTGLPPGDALTFWWLAMAIFGAATLGTLSRAYYLIKAGAAGGDAVQVATAYLRRQKADIAVVSVILLWGAANGILQLWLAASAGHRFFGLARIEASLLLTLPATLVLAVGLAVLSATARELRSNMKAFVGAGDVP
jgi:hypothetical protein